MTSFNIRLASVEDVKSFVKTAMSLPCEIYARSGKCVVDAKSIMGIFSLDLSMAITVEVPDEKYVKEFYGIGRQNENRRNKL